MLILGIESSCDETAASVVEDGRRVLSNIIASSVPEHARFGGVVPEIASRAHLESILPVVQQALAEAGTSLQQIDAIAVTRGPGLIGCLLVGMEFAKALAAAHGKPLIAVQHTAGHLYSPWIGREKDAWGTPVGEPMEFAPYIGLAISGGHTSMALVQKPLEFTTLGETLDDAVGEAYDKVAKLMGLGYPGGPLVDKIAADGNPEAVVLPRPLLGKPGMDFSFSGLKTAFAVAWEGAGPEREERVADFCASFQAACVDVIIGKAKRALKEYRLGRLAITGGVACNRGLRAAVAERLTRTHVAIPAPEFCTDNAAMIAGAAYHAWQEGARCDLEINARAQLPLSGGPAEWAV